jgi:DNA segregation ATPase FtsK/SpoIIIE-like protein
MSAVAELIDRYPELKIQIRVLGLIRDYQYNMERLKAILTKYGVKNVEGIEEKIKQGEVPEHPSYEDYLEALSHQENMKETIMEIRKIADSLEAEMG